MGKCVMFGVSQTLSVLLAVAVLCAAVQAQETDEGPASAPPSENALAPATENGSESDSANESAESGGHGDNHDPGHANAGPGLDSPAEWSTQLAIYTFVVFWIVLAILGKAAWPKISAALVEREKHIEGQITAAEGKHEEAKRLLAEHEARLASTADEVRDMLDEARRDAEATKTQIVAEARAAAEQEKQRAVREVELAADHAMKNMAEHSANLAVELAGKVIRETISPEKQAALVRESLAQLSASSPSNN